MEYKKCGKCGLVKPISKFNKNKNKKDGLNGWCKECRKEYRDNNKKKIVNYRKEHYQEHRDEILKHTQEYRNNHKKESKDYRNSHKKERQEYDNEFKLILNCLRVNGCSLCCSYEHLEFHHVIPEYKRFKISDGSGYSNKTFISELDKCMLLCKSCHMKVHSKSRKLNLHYNNNIKKGRRITP